MPEPRTQKRLLSTPLFTVEHREFVRAGGLLVARDVVVHPGAVVILPIVSEHRIAMIRNFRHTVGQELWELPAGTMEAGETPAETARRELEEETGYRAGRLTQLVEFYTSPGICTERMHAFVANDLTHRGQNLQSDERITVEVVDLADARRMLAGGRFFDGKTIAVLGTYFAQGAETKG
jgi:ADP-ribose pyrophosphatase